MIVVKKTPKIIFKQINHDEFVGPTKKYNDNIKN